MRLDQDIPGDAPTVQTSLTPQGEIDDSVRFSAGALYAGTPDIALSYLTGALIRYVSDGARSQVADMTWADPEAHAAGKDEHATLKPAISASCSQ